VPPKLPSQADRKQELLPAVTPSCMLAIMDEMARQGDDPAASLLRFGIFGAEP
jgi:phenylacetate-coenzyme A ligase PaaK-like adenylate-forming protein